MSTEKNVSKNNNAIAVLTQVELVTGKIVLSRKDQLNACTTCVTIDCAR